MMEQYESSSVVFDSRDVADVHDGGAPVGFHIRLAYRPEFAEQVDIIATTAHVIPIAEADADRAAGRRHRVGPPNNFLVTFAFGGLAIAVAGGPGIRRDDRWVTGGEQPLMIWPPTMSGISWPPTAPHIRSKTELHDFHNAIYARVRNPELSTPLLAAANDPGVPTDGSDGA